MELVRGCPITEFADANALGIRERLELLARVCDAVQHAHQRGIVHRDLKPGNILVDDHGQAKVLDFGVARLLHPSQTLTLQTSAGQIIGTLPYMSPEQASGDPARVDSRSDVYSLGVIGFELLAGRLPYDTHNRMLLEAVRVIREEDPIRLSTLSRAFQGDVETIVAKALEKDPAHRYASTSEFAADMRRYLHDEPVAARPPSVLYQLRKFSRRHRSLVVGVVVASFCWGWGSQEQPLVYSRLSPSVNEPRRARGKRSKPGRKPLNTGRSPSGDSPKPKKLDRRRTLSPSFWPGFSDRWTRKNSAGRCW